MKEQNKAYNIYLDAVVYKENNKFIIVRKQKQGISITLARPEGKNKNKTPIETVEFGENMRVTELLLEKERLITLKNCIDLYFEQILKE